MIGGSILGGLALISVIRRLSMPYFSALKFLNTHHKSQYLTQFEKEIYVQRPEENEISSLIKKSNADFYVIRGPKSKSRRL